ncbi:hypothetical protein [Myxococcus faecalis]|uniref:hypothetical protein n=1 Tax=Myxococcus faecalis TaxID=3115646 RepID=UPI003CECBE1C
MNPIFFADDDHTSTQYMIALQQALPTYFAKGYKTLFVEFLLIHPPANEGALKEEFYCCGTRREERLGTAYVSLIQFARKLGMKVFGLSIPPYYGVMRQFGNARSGEAFRQLGSFDAIAAQIVRTFASDHKYIVFLGSGHWHHLSARLEFLELVGPPYQANMVFTPQQMEQAQTWKKTYLRELVDGSTALSSQGHLVATWFGKKLTFNVGATTKLDEFAMLWQDKVGTPPDMDMLAAYLFNFAQRHGVLRLDL